MTLPPTTDPDPFASNSQKQRDEPLKINFYCIFINKFFPKWYDLRTAGGEGGKGGVLPTYVSDASIIFWMEDISCIEEYGET